MPVDVRDWVGSFSAVVLAVLLFMAGRVAGITFASFSDTAVVHSDSIGAAPRFSVDNTPATCVSNGTVRIQWSAPTGWAPYGYNVYRDTSSGGAFTTAVNMAGPIRTDSSVITACSGTLSYSIDDNPGGGTFYYKVKLVSNLSTQLSPAVMSNNIGEPIAVSGTYTGSSLVKYAVQVVTAGTDDPNAQVITTIQVSSDDGVNYPSTYTACGTTFSNPLLVSGTDPVSIGCGLSVTFGATGTGTSMNDTYKFTVQPLVEAPTASTVSNAATVTVAGSPPANLTAVAAASGAIHLCWSSVNGVDGYNVFRSVTSGSGYSQIAAPGNTVTTFDFNGGTPACTTSYSYADPGLTDAFTYYYVVESRTGAALSANSTEAHAPADSTAPSVSSVTPANGVTNISVNANSVITFSETMNQTTTDNAFTLIGGANGQAYATGFTVTGTTAVSIGDGLSIAFGVGGTTTNVGDTYTFSATASGPSVSAVSPSDASSEPATVSGSYTGTVDKTFIATVATAATDTSGTQVITKIQVSTDSLTCSTTGASCSWSTDGKSLTFDKSTADTNNLLPSTVYTVRVASSAPDPAGNTLVESCASAPLTDFCSTFTTKTSTTPDTTAPTVSSVSPANGSTSIPTNTNIVFGFSEAMDTGATQAAFCLYPAWGSCSVNTVAGGYNWSNVNSTLSFDVNGLLSSTIYRLTLGGGAGGTTDLAGNQLNRSNLTSEPMTLSGAYAGSTDANYAVKVASVLSGSDSNSTQFIASISVSMDGGSSFPSSYTACGTTFTNPLSLTNNAASVGCGLTVTFGATGITTAVNDTYKFAAIAPAKSNSTSEPITVSGTYAGTSDETIIVQVASVGSTEDAATQSIQTINVSTDGGATFPSTYTTCGSTFTNPLSLTNDAASIGCGLSVAFAAAGTTTAVSDTYAIQAVDSTNLRYSTAFTTAAGTGPTVQLTSPGDGQTSVNLNATVVITFSQAMNTTSVQNAFCVYLDEPAGTGSCASPYKVTGFAGTSGGVTYTSGFAWNSGSTTVTFKPAANLTASSNYHAAVSSSATNSLGVALANPKDFAFVTGTSSPKRTFVGPGTAMPGGLATFWGTSFATNVRKVELRWDTTTGTIIGSSGACQASNGNLTTWAVTGTIPFDATSGSHTVWALGYQSKGSPCNSASTSTSGSVGVVYPDDFLISWTEYAASAGDLATTSKQTDTKLNPSSITPTQSNTNSEPGTVTGTYTGTSGLNYVVNVVTKSGNDNSTTQVITGIQVSTNGGSTYGSTITVSGTTAVSIGNGLSIAFGVTGISTVVNNTYSFTPTTNAAMWPDGKLADVTVTALYSGAPVGTGVGPYASNSTSEPATLSGTYTGTSGLSYKVKVTAAGTDSTTTQNITEIKVSTDNGTNYGSALAVSGTTARDIGNGLFIVFGVTGTTTKVNDTYSFTATAPTLVQANDTGEIATLSGSYTGTTYNGLVIKVAAANTDTSTTQSITSIKVSWDGGSTYNAANTKTVSGTTVVALTNAGASTGLSVAFDVSGTTTAVDDVYFPSQSAGIVFSVTSSGCTGTSPSLSQSGSSAAPLNTIIGGFPNAKQGSITTTLTACTGTFTDTVVSARTGNGLSKFVRFTDPPAPPPDFSLSPGSIKIAWQPSISPLATGYTIYLGTKSGDYARTYDVGNVTQFHVTDVTPGTTYYVVLRSYNVKGDLGDPTVEKSITIGGAPACGTTQSSLTAGATVTGTPRATITSTVAATGTPGATVTSTGTPAAGAGAPAGTPIASAMGTTTATATGTATAAASPTACPTGTATAQATPSGTAAATGTPPGTASATPTAAAGGGGQAPALPDPTAASATATPGAATPTPGAGGSGGALASPTASEPSPTAATATSTILPVGTSTIGPASTPDSSPTATSTAPASPTADTTATSAPTAGASAIPTETATVAATAAAAPSATSPPAATAAPSATSPPAATAAPSATNPPASTPTNPPSQTPTH